MAPVPIPRPLLLRLLSVTAISLPPILYLISLALTVKVTFSPAYAVAKLYDSFGKPNGLVVNASPFYDCTPAPTTAIDDITTTTYAPTCTRLTHFLGAKGLATCETLFAVDSYEDTQICQKMVASASLYVAGAVLVGLALGLAVLHAAVSWPGAFATHERPSLTYAYAPVRPPTTDEKLQKMHAPATDDVFTPIGLREEGVNLTLPYVWALVGTLATLFALLAAGCVVLAQTFGVQALVNEQHPTAADDPNAYHMGRWYMGAAAYGLSSVAWLAAAVGAFAAGSRCGAISRR